MDCRSRKQIFWKIRIAKRQEIPDVSAASMAKRRSRKCGDHVKKA
jgi:hypothetical protein